MCMMCEQEALYDAYQEYVARKEAEAAAGGKAVKGDSSKNASFKAQGFNAEAIEDDADGVPDGLTVLRAPPTAETKEN